MLFFLLVSFLLLTAPILSVNAQQAAIRKKVSTLLQKMTLAEKVGQMAQITVDSAILHDAIVNYKIGSVLNVVPGKLYTAADWNRFLSGIQKEAKQTRLKIPLLYGLDDIHGVNYVDGATLFPQQIGQAATFNKELVRQVAEITAYEARAAGIPWNFSPVLDLGVNPQWSRLWEGFGEDPYVVKEMGLAAINGYQNPAGNKGKVAATLKHFLGYSDPKSGKDRTDAWIPEHYLREYHLPAFAAAVKAGAKTVMVNSALINGIPTHINKHVLTDILKTELGFRGFVVTDWNDIDYVYKRDHVAKSEKDAIRLAINAGIDMAMIPYDYKNFCRNLIELVKEGEVPLSRIDDAVSRILTVKFELDLFNTPETFLKDYPEFGSGAFRQVSYQTAAESVTLLKNKNRLLPLKPGTKIMVCGPNADNMRSLNGGWSYSWQGNNADEYAGDYHTIREALVLRFGENNVTYLPGVHYMKEGNFNEDKVVDIDAAVKAAEMADVIVLCVGENSYTETPGNLDDLRLSDNQFALAAALNQAGKPIVLVLNEGRPRIISSIAPQMDAIIQTYLPGNFGADALADILTGKINPSGKLPYTYPRNTNSLTNYLHKPADDAGFNPQFRFGEGLSYSKFDYSNLRVSQALFDASETATVKVDIRNNSAVAGKEVVMLFSIQAYASITPDVKRLRRFDKISLAPGEKKTVSFVLPVRELAVVGLQHKKVLEEGRYEFEIGGMRTGFDVEPAQKKRRK